MSFFFKDPVTFDKRPEGTDEFSRKLVAYDSSGFGWAVTPDLSGTGITLQPNPTFYRDFAALKTLDHGEGPNITFTRGSSATYFDSAGVLRVANIKEPRFDHDPVTGASLGLLIEEQRVNHLIRSEEFNTWTLTQASVSVDVITAPTGNVTADKFIESTDPLQSHVVTKNTTNLSPSSFVTCSVFAKAAERDALRIVVWDSSAANNSIGANFTLTGNGLISNISVNGNGSNQTASISSVGNGWYRCSVSGIPNTTGIAAGCGMYLLSGGNIVYTGDGTSGLYIWGAQLEAGAFPTSYIPTTTTEATRAADSAVVEPISSFYNQSEGTLFAEWISGPTGVTSGTRRVAAFISSIIQDSIQLVSSATNSVGPYLFANIANVTGATAPSSPSAALFSSTYKLAGAWRTGQVSASINGGAVADSVGTEYPTNIQNFRIGRLGSGTELCGHIRKVAYWPKRLSNTFLQEQTQ